MRCVGWLLVAAAAVAGCGSPAQQLAQAPAYQPEGQAKASVATNELRPLVIEWPASDRLQLETRLQRGVVAVRYQNHELAVLERCTIDAHYAYLGGTRKTDALEIRNRDELYAKLPVGALGLEGELRSAGELVVTMTLVGRFESDHPVVHAAQLRGDCDGATHFVYAATVGAFVLSRNASGLLGGGASSSVASAGGQSSSASQVLNRDGNPDACATATDDDKLPPSQCAGLIRLDLVPLKGSEYAFSCQEGSHWDGTRCVSTEASNAYGLEPTSDRESTNSAVPKALRWSAVATLGVAAVGAILVGTANSTVSSHCDANRLCDDTGLSAAGRGRAGAWMVDIALPVAAILGGLSFLPSWKEARK